MKVEFKANDKVTLVAEGESQLEVFENLASMQEVFAEEKCGKCSSDRLSFKVRKVPDGKKFFYYPELVCQKCYAKLTYGQSDAGLFPIRYERKEKEYVKDANGKNIPLGTNGWIKWNKEKGVSE